MNIALYGFMGVGKTTVGKLLAERLGYTFIDMDDEIEKTAGMSVSEIFTRLGEPSFRQMESKLIEELSRKDGYVIACGGGAIANPYNAERLSASAGMVYLTAEVDEIIKRTSGDNSRPLLNVPNPHEVVSNLLADRALTYKKYAEIIVDTTGFSPEEVVSAIVEAIR